MIEIWKPVENYEEEYSVSNQGRVKSHKYKQDRIRKPSNNGKRYYYVGLSKGCKRTNHYIHRLVAKHFVPNANKKTEVNHKDGNKNNNCYENLEWVTSSENSIHAYESSLNKSIGENHWANKLTRQSVEEIKLLCAAKEFTQREIAEKFNVSQSVVNEIHKRKSWKLQPEHIKQLRL